MQVRLYFNFIFLHFTSRMSELNGVDDQIDFQTAYVADIVKESNYGYNIDVSEKFKAWNIHRRDQGITTYRNQSFTSKFTGTKSPLPRTPFMQEFDHSMHHFLSQF